MPKKRRLGPCYVCGKPGNSLEHVPPQCLFDEEQRKQLITVPSCDEHNLRKSGDDQYLDFVLSVALQANRLARRHFDGAPMRALQRRPYIALTMFSGLQPITLDGDETAYFTLDIDRIRRAMSAIASGMYYYLTGSHYTSGWQNLSTSTISLEQLSGEIEDPWEDVKRELAKLPYREIKTHNPETFWCGVSGNHDRNIVFWFRFFEGIDFFVFTAPSEAGGPQRRSASNCP